MVICGKSFSESVEDPMLEETLRDLIALNAAQCAGTAELVEHVETAPLLLISADNEIVCWPGAVANGRMLVLSYEVPHTDAMMVELESRPDKPHIVHFHKLSEFDHVNCVNWTLRYDVGSVHGDAPLFSLTLERGADANPTEASHMEQALGTANASRHFRTLRLVSEVMQEASNAA